MMAKSTERHKRESLAVAGEIMSVSREQVRKAGKVARYFRDGEELLMSGKVSTDRLYRLMKQDNRVGLYAKISPELRTRIRATAKAEGVTVSELLESVLTQIFG